MGSFLGPTICSKGCATTVFNLGSLFFLPHFLWGFFLSLLCSSYFLVSSVFSFSFTFCWASQHYGWVFLLLPVLWQKFTTWLMCDIVLNLQADEGQMKSVGMLSAAVEGLWTFVWVLLFKLLLRFYFICFLGLVFLYFLCIDVFSDLKSLELHPPWLLFRLTQVISMKKFLVLKKICIFPSL